MTAPYSELAEAILADPWWDDDTLLDLKWRAAFDAVPRHLFAPGTWYEWNGTGWNTCRRDDDEDAWLRAVYAVDKPLITQVGADGAPTSSLSAPVLVAAMLGALDLADGMRVYESGTGSGWTAALMSHRLGVEGFVISTECDHELRLQAEYNLKKVHNLIHPPVLHTGDGERGCPDLGKFDRVSATHAVSRVPRAWIRDTRRGGLICAPLNVAGTGLDLYVRLTVRKGGLAEGRVLFPLAFMPSRTAATTPRADLSDGPGRSGKTDLDLPAIVADKLLWVLQLAVPGLTVTGPVVEDGDDTVWLSTPDGSWAVGYVPQGAPWDGAVVEQHGPTDVWTLAEAACASWETSGRPRLDEYGLTVLSSGEHRLWCREPGNVVATLR